MRIHRSYGIFVSGNLTVFLFVDNFEIKIWYAPVTKDDEIISIITFVGDGKVACTISEGYVDVLNRLLNESSDDAVKLFAFSGQIYGAIEDRVYNSNFALE